MPFGLSFDLRSATLVGIRIVYACSFPFFQHAFLHCAPIQEFGAVVCGNALERTFESPLTYLMLYPVQSLDGF